MINNFSEPTNIVISNKEIIPNVLDKRLDKNPNQEILKFKVDNVWTSKTTKEFNFEVIETAKGLLASGLSKGDKVAILASTCFEWTLLDFVCLSLGLIVVPIYETSSQKQIKYILEDSGAKLLFVGTRELKEKARSANNDIEIQCFSENAIGALQVIGESIPTETFRKVKENVKSKDLATIVYTSGSTGTPKGVELTHSAFLNIIYNGIKGMPELLAREPEARLLLFLPLAHVFARYLQFVAIAGTSILALSPSTSTLLDDLAYFKPTYMLGVPRVFEKVYNSASQKAGGGIKGLIFSKASKTAINYSKRILNKKRISSSLQIKYNIYDKLVYSTLRKVLGGEVEYIVSGGAPLNDDLAHFFTGISLPLLQGYGLTESAAPTMVNRPNNNQIGSIGQPLPGVEVKLGDDNELMIRSKSLFTAYHNQKELTKETLVDGWLKTGDEAKIMDDGSVIITGRIKDIIVTAGGKNVSPSPLEEIITSDPFISAAVVLGDKRPFVSALITIDEEYTKAFFKSKGLKFPKNKKALVENPFIVNKVVNAIDKANETVSRAETIKKWIILEDEFSEKNSLMTPTLKVKRSKVIETYHREISRKIYATPLKKG